MKNQSIIPSLQQIVNFLQEETINQIAKETGFSVRKRKLSAIVFLGMFTFGLIQSPPHRGWGRNTNGFIPPT